MAKHQEHIVCVKSSKVDHHQNGFVDYELKLEDLMIGQRAVLEHDNEFRQVLPISVFVCNGKVWAYERTSKGGESRLHNKIAIAVGGHWDMSDLELVDGVVDMQGSIERAMSRELNEEIELTSNIISTVQLKHKICSVKSDVDRVHLGIVYVHTLDGEGVKSVEDQLKDVGFIAPSDLLDGSYNAEEWATLIAQKLIES